MKTLHLEVKEYVDPCHWRWSLTDVGGKFLADHEVNIDGSAPEYMGLLDLERYLDRYAAPDNWIEDQSRLIADMGVWIERYVLGNVAKAIVTTKVPVAVRVIIPEEAVGLFHIPLELAYVGGRPLVLQDVSLVYEIAGESSGIDLQRVGERLRMLAIFSLPTGATALALRHERHELKKIIREIVQMVGCAVELRLLQYGASRDALKEALEEGDGWDLIHFSGHGQPGKLVLETLVGGADEIDAHELVRLLRFARGHLKLVVLSACWSAAATIAETLNWLGIEPPTDTRSAIGAKGTRSIEPGSETGAEGASEHVVTLSRAIAGEIGCAVLAMRYPVGDQFAVDLGAHLYRLLFEKKQTVTRALQIALPNILGKAPSSHHPPLSVATPALFGTAAIDLKLPPPEAHGAPALFEGMAEFPSEPERFVGRTGAMARASQALAPSSGKTGVLFYGMPGGGKTTSALELGYRYEISHFQQKSRFRYFIWYKAPEEAADITTALRDFAMAVERQVPGFKMVHVVDRTNEFEAWLPHLRMLLEHNSMLLVLDNLESLLTSAGGWRDNHWKKLICNLTHHRGLSRVILTSRRRPEGINARGPVVTEAVHALTLEEAALLVRELPNLSRLLTAGNAADLERGRALVHRTLTLIQGHPKLLELADRLAADPIALEAQLNRAVDAWRGDEGRLEAFFRDGKSSFGEADYFATLSKWTSDLGANLPTASLNLFHALCVFEEDDRNSMFAGRILPCLQRRMKWSGKPWDLAEALAPLTATGLVDVEPATEEVTSYRIHSGVAEAGRADVSEEFRTAVYEEMSTVWREMFIIGRHRETAGGGAMVVRAGLAAVPYLMRLQRWDDIALMVEKVSQRDFSPSTLAILLPLMRRTVDAAGLLSHRLVMANLLLKAGRADEAMTLFENLIVRAKTDGDFRLAVTAAARVTKILQDEGHHEEALNRMKEVIDYSRRARVGPWTQLADEGQRLQILKDLGRWNEVVASLEKLRKRMDGLPQKPGQNETVDPWNVREFILECGRVAAQHFAEWNKALEINAEIVESARQRGAPVHEIAKSRFNDYDPLLRMQRPAEALSLLLECRNTFQEVGDHLQLGMVFSALATVEDVIGHPDQAIAYEEVALRYKYLRPLPHLISASHFNYAATLLRADEQHATAWAHLLAAALIDLQTKSGYYPSTLTTVAMHMADFLPDKPPLPDSFNRLCEIVGKINGVRFSQLFEQLPKSSCNTGNEALKAVIGAAMHVLKDMAEGTEAEHVHRDRTPSKPKNNP